MAETGDLKVSVTEKKADTEVPKAKQEAVEPSGSKFQSKISSKSSKSRFNMTKWNPVAMWAMDLVEGDCAICRSSNEGACNECQARRVEYGCGTVYGLCNHRFHDHCMDSWLSKGRPVCPLDMNPWERDILRSG